MSSTEFDPNNKSEIARMRWLIERNCEALLRVSNDAGFSAKHETIRKRYTAFGKREEQLAKIVGAEKANQIAYGIYNEVMNRADEEG
ncbi:MAG TPA: hypothetical protein VKU38_12915 [Ktedonobacteraceae bacterium]|nr:hypothetical protein [Ktedonobacteraceae bacterium]